jgi:integrase
LVEGELKLVGGEKITSKKTPLLLALKPEEILAYNPTRPDLRLFALLGYFFSLRPQEVVALTPRDFAAGTEAAMKECAKVMAKAGMYTRLSVHITKQRSSGKIKTPKAGSIGWVSCFQESAAREIIKLIFGKPADEPLFANQMDWYYKLWRREGIPQSTVKDLRRASLYHLGHYSELGGQTPVGLMNHARHKHIQTTMLYCRRPEEWSKDDWKALDLDA